MTSQLKPLPIGFHANFPEIEYHAKRLGVVSKSAIDRIRPPATPAHYRAWLAGVEPEKASDVLTFGRAGHCAILEPDRFLTDYVEAPEFGDMRYKVNKEARAEWLSELDSLEGREVISAADGQKLRSIQASLHSHELVRKLLAGGQNELTGIWEDDETGLTCKIRADHYSEELATVADIKLVKDASPDGFRKAVANYRYDIQDAFYRSGFRALGKPVKHFAFIACEKVEPYASAVYVLEPEWVDRGEQSARENMELMAHCLRTDDWPGYGRGIQTLEMPGWMR